MTQNETLLTKCPICKHALSISKEDFDGGMDGRYYDWVIRCDNCGLLKYNTAADNFYGREYSATQQDAIIKFNKYVSRYNGTKETKDKMKLAMIFESSDEMPMSPKEFCDEMKRLADYDTQTWHMEADDLMCSLLRTLGYEDGVEVFESEEKWYA